MVCMYEYRLTYFQAYVGTCTHPKYTRQYIHLHIYWGIIKSLLFHFEKSILLIKSRGVLSSSRIPDWWLSVTAISTHCWVFEYLIEYVSEWLSLFIFGDGHIWDLLPREDHPGIYPTKTSIIIRFNTYSGGLKDRTVTMRWLYKLQIKRYLISTINPGSICLYSTSAKPAAHQDHKIRVCLSR